MKNLVRSWKYILIAAGLGLLTMLVLGFNSRMAELRRLSGQAELVSTQLEALKQTQMLLDTQIAYAESGAAVEQWAYEEAHWVRPGDQPVVPIPQETSAAPAPAEIPAVETEIPNWKLWWALFFDGSL
jgi:hypothetical protein